VFQSTPAAANRAKVSLRLKPASTRRRVRPVATSVEFPALDDASTVMPKMAMPSHSLSLKARVTGKRNYNEEI
jgi:hypothetical protein